MLFVLLNLCECPWWQPIRKENKHRTFYKFLICLNLISEILICILVILIIKFSRKWVKRMKNVPDVAVMLVLTKSFPFTRKFVYNLLWRLLFSWDTVSSIGIQHACAVLAATPNSLELLLVSQATWPLYLCIKLFHY